MGDGNEKRILSRRGVPADTQDLLLECGGACEQDAYVTLLVVSGADHGPVTRCGINSSRRGYDGRWGNESYQSFRDDMGLCTLDRLLPGTELCITVKATGLGSTVLDGIVAADEGTELKVVLPALAAADITVMDAGAPAAYSIVTLSRHPESCVAALHSARETSRRADDRGHCVWTDLDPGHYTLLATHDDRTARLEVDLAPGSVSTRVLDVH